MRNLSGHLHSETEELVQLDTGYSEEILIPHSLFESLDLRHWRLPQSLAVRGTTVTGHVIQFLEARADVTVSKAGTHRVIVQTFVGNTRFLIGRAFLRRFKTLLDGPDGQTCLMK